MEPDNSEIHPPYLAFRILRGLRFARHLRGWGRLSDRLAPTGVNGAFRVVNGDAVFEGNISSFIDRLVYLYGEYEQQVIELFLKHVPKTRRRVVLDVGANIGTHSVSFSKHFEIVHAFDPNPQICVQFMRNVELSRIGNIRLHRIGLGRGSADLPFYLTEKNNLGMGTFSRADQYDVPLKEVGTLRVEDGDAYIAGLHLAAVDAIKIDTQGFEREVLAGLQETLAQFRPVVWFEYAAEKGAIDGPPPDIRTLFPYPVTIWRIVRKSRVVLNSFACELVGDRDPMPYGDYIIACEERRSGDNGPIPEGGEQKRA